MFDLTQYGREVKDGLWILHGRDIAPAVAEELSNGIPLSPGKNIEIVALHTPSGEVHASVAFNKYSKLKDFIVLWRRNGS